MRPCEKIAYASPLLEAEMFEDVFYERYNNSCVQQKNLCKCCKILW